MKLINKFTLWYLCIALACTVIGNSITYYSLKNKIDHTETGGLNHISKLAADQLETDQVLSGLQISTLWKWALILFLIAISARLVSRAILSPFNKTLKAIGSFNLQQKEKIQLPATNTKEFKELNAFVKTMADKAVEEYASLKEFTENASHELQTPVAVMRGKLELLAESAITNEQALLITDIQNSLEKLSRINSSLILLTRLENHEYAAKEPLHFCKMINESLAAYKELTEMKSISLTKNVAKSVYVQLHPTLGDLLLNNLISNAIRHNVPNGSIDVQLTHKSLIIQNTGPEPTVPTAELFQRFKKSNQCSKSIGIGLAIVKQICDIHQFDIQYTYKNGLHVIKIWFTAVYSPTRASVSIQQPQLSFIGQPAI